MKIVACHQHHAVTNITLGLSIYALNMMNCVSIRFLYLATWFASVDVSDDKQISRTELFKFMKKTIKGNIYCM